MRWIKVGLMCRRKALLVVVLVLITVLVFLKQNHFSRSDVLKPVRKSKFHESAEVRNKEIQGNFLGNAKQGANETNGETFTESIWDKWMADNIKLTSIGDTYDKCGKKFDLTSLPQQLERIVRSSYRRRSVKRMFLIISQNSRENACVRVSFLIKSREACNLKMRLRQVFSCEF